MNDVVSKLNEVFADCHKLNKNGKAEELISPCALRSAALDCLLSCYDPSIVDIPEALALLNLASWDDSRMLRASSCSPSPLYEKKSIRVFTRLLELIAMKERNGGGQELNTDISFINTIADQSQTIFDDTIELFAQAMKESSGGVSKPPSDLSNHLKTMVIEMEQHLQKMNDQLGQKTESDVGNGSPRTSQHLADVFSCFSRTLDTFNALFQSEICSWKVAAIELDKHLGTSSLEANQNHQVYLEILTQFRKVRQDYTKITAKAEAKITLDQIEIETMEAISHKLSL